MSDEEMKNLEKLKKAARMGVVVRGSELCDECGCINDNRHAGDNTCTECKSKHQFVEEEVSHYLRNQAL